MTIRKETRDAAFRACSLSEDDIVIILLIYVENYQQAKREGKSEQERHEIFSSIEELSMIILIKTIGKNPLQILNQLSFVERAVNIITPHEG